ncbi:tetratricopeptide repeat protein [Robbsia sp. Bb-Pol-6]|uniref:Tetratricopeptide repeat protein n=1 Tax=Robbsia betulipollinis TaxID=2981849 RepID=A0ABT3ZL55_9BURK|nr:tetratricopeptide repeat protein [Robbsia betulipollinis]MCY0387268.1 tetratricopeptide repeat protein [Robbsia betulipollinis]
MPRTLDASPVAGAPPALTPQSLALLELLAFVYLQNRRPDNAATLLEALLATGAANERACGALALAQLRIGRPGAALTTLERATLRTRLEPAFQLLRAQALGALHRPDEAAAAMAAFVDARRARATAAPHA